MTLDVEYFMLLAGRIVRFTIPLAPSELIRLLLVLAKKFKHSM